MNEPIRIVAAIATDERGRLLLVRKSGTSAFMQPGGKVEPGEDLLEALARELREELGCSITMASAAYAGRRSAPAANEPGRTVEAELYRITLEGVPTPAAEIAEMIWLDVQACDGVVLAPLTREHILPLVRS